MLRADKSEKRKIPAARFEFVLRLAYKRTGFMKTSFGPDPEQLLRPVREGNGAAMGQLLELYRDYLALLVRLQIGRRLQGKVDPLDVVQDTFLSAHQKFAQFRGTTEAELIGWLRQIMASRMADVMRRYHGAQRRDVRLERELAVELDESSRVLDHGLVAPGSTPSHRPSAANRPCSWPKPWGGCRRTIARSLSCTIWKT
jgi:hypothetical protein